MNEISNPLLLHDPARISDHRLIGDPQPRSDLRDIPFLEDFRIHSKLRNDSNWLGKIPVQEYFLNFLTPCDSSSNMPMRKAFKIIEWRRIFLANILPREEDRLRLFSNTRSQDIVCHEIERLLIDVNQIPLLPLNNLGDARVKME